MSVFSDQGVGFKRSRRRFAPAYAAAGAGKSYLGCAFGVAACRNFYSVKYIRLSELMNDLAVARGEGTYKKVIKDYKKNQLATHR